MIKSASHSLFSIQLDLLDVIENALWAYNDVVDWYVDELDEESDESHDAEANGRCKGNLLELPTVWLRTSLN